MDPTIKTIKTAIHLHLVTEREIRYHAALRLVGAIEPEPGLSRLPRHWRNKAGRLLATLDEVVRAILADELAVDGKATAAAEWIEPVAA